MNHCKDKSYQYKGKTYRINPFQQSLFKKIKSLPRKHLHYIVIQQSNHRPNINLKQMQSAIRRAVREYVDETNYPYRPELKNLLVKYVCVFETSKEFHESLFSNDIVEVLPPMGLHLHLFITSPDHCSWICFNTLSYRILHELGGLPNRGSCISKYDYKKLNVFDDGFILYHTKQFYERPSKEMVIAN